MHDFEANWRPIETAPKDDRWVLLYDPRMEMSVAMGTYLICDERDPRGRFKAGDWCLMEWDGVPSHCSPTHWMPLPEPPDDGFAKPVTHQHDHSEGSE